jgi:hypothetical protein
MTSINNDHMHARKTKSNRFQQKGSWYDHDGIRIASEISPSSVVNKTRKEITACDVAVRTLWSIALASYRWWRWLTWRAALLPLGSFIPSTSRKGDRDRPAAGVLAATIWQRPREYVCLFVCLQANRRFWKQLVWSWELCGGATQLVDVSLSLYCFWDRRVEYNGDVYTVVDTSNREFGCWGLCITLFCCREFYHSIPAMHVMMRTKKWMPSFLWRPCVIPKQLCHTSFRFAWCECDTRPPSICQCACLRLWEPASTVYNKFVSSSHRWWLAINNNRLHLPDREERGRAPLDSTEPLVLCLRGGRSIEAEDEIKDDLVTDSTCMHAPEFGTKDRTDGEEEMEGHYYALWFAFLEQCFAGCACKAKHIFADWF